MASEVPAGIIDNILYSRIAPSFIHGFGLFATKALYAGTILGTLDGQVMDWDEYDQLREAINLPDEVRKNIFMEWNALAEDTLLVRPLRTKYSFINHSRTPNLTLKRNPLRIIALRDIQEGEEFTLDYRDEPLRKEYLDGHGNTYL